MIKIRGELSDLELVKLLQQGDRAAFTEIYTRHWEAAYRAAYTILNEEAACMDVVQDVFVWLWDNHTKVEISHLAAYLRTAVKFKMLNVIRDGKLREDLNLNVPVLASYTDTTLEVKELKELIDRFSNSLPPQARTIFHLSRNKYYSNKEIANEMGISEKTVKNQLNISLKKLKGALGNMSFWSLFL